ncbi:cobyric acid synthase [Brevundimonas vesicularis]|uniref:cobyric acid synthase n=1 Tax=Brevundimonas vesicularis TaxID=41276 RepID=UPI0038D3A300
MAAIMIQGCGSDVGKSVLVAGLCRLFTRRGLKVRPFKPQNMSNNAAVTAADGQGRMGEIGRAQALQAMACRTPPTVDMNPVLLKPQSDTGAQLVVRGQVQGSWKARGYQAHKPALLDIVLESFEALKAEADLVIVEGAGSPAEINLRAGDIANMGFALAAEVPVILVGDIDRGHVIAALAGAHTVLNATDRGAIKGFMINKFRGDPALFDEGRQQIQNLTGWPDMGMVPWLKDTAFLPAEDAVVLQSPLQSCEGKRLKIAVPLLSRIANFDDFDPLRLEPQIDLSFVPPGQVISADTDVIIIPGTKSTLSDLAFLRAQGWDIDILSHVRRGGRVIGICGGYQILGRIVHDLKGLEGSAGSAEGLSLLDVETRLEGQKTLKKVQGLLTLSDAPFTGYEIHIGQTTGPDTAQPVGFIDGLPQGAVSSDGKVMGLYVHGLFDQSEARAALFPELYGHITPTDHSQRIHEALDRIADILEAHLDIPTLSKIAGL